MNYKKETLDFLKRVNANVKITPIGCEKPLWSSRYYSTYRVTISRNGKRYTYKYYDNINTPIKFVQCNPIFLYIIPLIKADMH